MKDGNNGGYANNWLMADRKTNEVASLELGLKNVTLQRTKDGFFVGSNFPERSEADQGGDGFRRRRIAARARTRVTQRWLTLMEQNKGKIDSAAAEKFLGDHFDTFAGKVDSNERTLCGHIDAFAARHGDVATAVRAGRRGAE